MQVYEVIADAFKRDGISYAELGRRCGIDKDKLRLSLIGERELRPSELVKLSMYFNISMSDFYDAA